MRALGASRTSVATGGILGANWARDPLWKNARAVPSLDLRFAENKSLTDAKTGASLVTFTRASTGTFVGSDGLVRSATTNEARFDHNPTTGESLGLLVEEARTNLLLRSEEFDNASWSKFQCSITANATTSPNGTTTADKLITNNAVSGNLFCGTTLTAASYTLSIFAKASEFSWILLGATTAGNAGVWFNLASGIVGTQNAGYTGAIQSLGSGWYRCSVTFTATAASWNTIVFSTNADNTFTNGNGTSGIFLWGAQLEAGAFPTSYIPTTTATVTRAADVPSITGTAFSSWYRQDEGTVFAEATASPNIFTSYVAISNGTTSQNSTYFDNDTGIIRSVTFSASTAVSVLGLGSIGTVGTGNKLTSAYKTNNFAAARNGGTVQTDTSGNVPVSVTQLDIGRNPNAAATTYINGTIKRLTYWPVRLADPTLVSITQP